MIRIVERKQRGLLYHFTALLRAGFILESGKFKSMASKYLSLTRNPVMMKGPSVPYEARFTLDGDSITDTYEIEPYQDINSVTRSTNQEWEEIVTLESKKTLPIDPYVLRIDILNQERYQNKGETREELFNTISHGAKQYGIPVFLVEQYASIRFQDRYIIQEFN